MNKFFLGTVTEQLFIYEALKHGFQVFKPVFSGNCKYDCIVDVNGKLLRIQVKTLMRDVVHNRNYYHAGFDSSYHVLYKKEDLDFFALFHPLLSKFFILPFVSLRGVSIPPLNSQSKYHKYLDNWEFNK